MTSTPSRRTRTSAGSGRSEEHTSELQSQSNLVCRLLLEKKKATRRHGRISRINEASSEYGTGSWDLQAAALTCWPLLSPLYFFFNDPATTELYTLSLHDALPILTAATYHNSLGGPFIFDDIDAVAKNPHIRRLW